MMPRSSRLCASAMSGSFCMHAENGGAIDVIVHASPRRRKRAPKYHALTRPTTAEAEATSRAIALAEMAGAPVYIVHLSCNDAPRKSPRSARPRPARLRPRPARITCIFPWKIWTPRLEGAQVCLHSPLREKWHQEKLWQRASPKDHLQLFPPTTAPSASRTQKSSEGRFHQDSQWRPRHRAPLKSRVYPGGPRQTFFAEPFCPAGCNRAR